MCQREWDKSGLPAKTHFFGLDGHPDVRGVRRLPESLPARAEPTACTHRVPGRRGRNPRRNSCSHGSLCGLTMKTAVSIWWARGARNPFGPAPAGANGPRPHGCEPTRSNPLVGTLRIGRLDSRRDSLELMAVRPAVAPEGASPRCIGRREPIPITACYQDRSVRAICWTVR